MTIGQNNEQHINLLITKAVLGVLGLVVLNSVSLIIVFVSTVVVGGHADGGLVHGGLHCGLVHVRLLLDGCFLHHWGWLTVRLDWGLAKTAGIVGCRNGDETEEKSGDLANPEKYI